jgi:hypothetical protein
MFNLYNLYVINNTNVKHNIPEWSEKEYEILELAYVEIINSGDTPLGVYPYEIEEIGVYPYEIEEREFGYSIRFRVLGFLQIITSPKFTGEINDGCVYYHFSKDIKLLKTTRCG